MRGAAPTLRAALTSRRLAYAACLIGMALCLGGPLQIRDAEHRHESALAGQEIQARVVEVDAVATRLPLQPASAFHVVAFEQDGRTRTERLAGAPEPGSSDVPVLVGADGAVSSQLALQAERAQAMPRAFIFAASLLVLLHMLVVDRVRRRAIRRAQHGDVLRLVPELEVHRAA